MIVYFNQFTKHKLSKQKKNVNHFTGLVKVIQSSATKMKKKLTFR